MKKVGQFLPAQTSVHFWLPISNIQRPSEFRPQKGEDFMLSKAMKRTEMNILNAVHLLYLFSFKLTKTPFEAL